MSVHHTGRYICSPGGGGGGAAGRLLVDFVPMLEQKTMRKGTFFKLGSAQHCHRLGSEKQHFSGKRVGFLKYDKNKGCD